MFSSSALSVASSTPWVTVASAVTFGLVGFPAGRPAALTADTGVSSVAVGAAAAAGWSPLTVAARCARMASALALWRREFLRGSSAARPWSAFYFNFRWAVPLML